MFTRKPLYLLLSAALLSSSLTAHAKDVCYTVADNDPVPGSADVLIEFDKTTAVSHVVGFTSTAHIEALVFHPTSRQLYAANADRLGTLDLLTGIFLPLNQPFGNGNGAIGTVKFNDVDGLTFNPRTAEMYGTQRLIEGQKDLLFKINPVSGEAIHDAFGAGVDYVVVQGNALLDVSHNVDDIAIDPASEVMYATVNASGKYSYLVSIDIPSGSVTIKGQILDSTSGQPVDDIEGLGFDAQGNLYGSTGFKNDVTKGYLYTVDKNTGLVTLVSNFSNNVDFEGVTCLSGGEDPYVGGKCHLYAVQDEGLNNSQLITIEPISGAVAALGPKYNTYDIEALDIDPVTDELYATTGWDNKMSKQGYLYKVDKTTGALTEIGFTGFKAVPGLSFNPVTHELWGFTDQTIGNKGLVTINTATGAATMVHKSSSTEPKKIEGLSWSKDGTVLYGSDQNKLWAYTPATGYTLQCNNFPEEVEGLETMPNGLLAFTMHPNNKTDVYTYDPVTCTLADGQRFVTPYYDLESVAWPEYCDPIVLNGQGIPNEVAEVQSMVTFAKYLQSVGLNVIETNANGTISVTSGDVTFLVRPSFQSNLVEDGESISEGFNIATEASGAAISSMVLGYYNDDEELRKQALYPAPLDVEVFKTLLAKLVPNVSKVEVAQTGEVTITVAGQHVKGILDYVVHKNAAPASANGAIQMLGDIDGNGLNDFLITYPNGTTQVFFYKGN